MIRTGSAGAASGHHIQPAPRLASKLRTGARLTNLIAVSCILSWRVFLMTMLDRLLPDAAPTLALTKVKITLLDKLANDRDSSRRKTLEHYLIKIARLGGYLNRANDPPPGNMVMWRGLSRLTDIALGATLDVKIVGNGKRNGAGHSLGRLHAVIRTLTHLKGYTAHAALPDDASSALKFGLCWLLRWRKGSSLSERRSRIMLGGYVTTVATLNCADAADTGAHQGLAFRSITKPSVAIVGRGEVGAYSPQNGVHEKHFSSRAVAEARSLS